MPSQKNGRGAYSELFRLRSRNLETQRVKPKRNGRAKRSVKNKSTCRRPCCLLSKVRKMNMLKRQRSTENAPISLPPQQASWRTHILDENTPTPCRDVSRRVIRGDRRRCGVSESSPSSLSLPTRSVVVLLPTPVRAGTNIGAKPYALIRVNAYCNHKFTERGTSSASRSSAACRIPRRTHGAPPRRHRRRALEQLLCRGV
jgi:hypothetical protein